LIPAFLVRRVGLDFLGVIQMGTKLSWGFAGPWYGEFLKMDEDSLRARLKFLKHYNLKEVSLSLQELEAMSKDNEEWLEEYLTKNDMRLSPRVGFDYLDVEIEEAKQKTEEIEEGLRNYRHLLNGHIVTTGATIGHRFDNIMPLAEKLERLSKVLTPLAEVCQGFGTPLAIENHGDYYCSDLVQLCKETPDLYIFLDTGNPYLIGEQPLPAFEVAAPFTIGTHFKDHRVRPCPDARPLHFEVAESILGEGDVPLRECYNLLLKKAPFPNKLVMEIEMISPIDVNPIEALEKSLEFIHSLGGEE
jgi:sugar phosphate isomerase/epimerase